MKPTLRQTILKATARGRHEVRCRVPPGLRWVVGLFLVAFGFLGFLPILGFWMIPLGVAVMAMDIAPLVRRNGRKHEDDDDKGTR